MNSSRLLSGRLIRLITSFIFKEVHIIGAENVPTDGPLIISGTHNSQFMDAAMLLLAVKREVNFVIAASSARKKTLGFFLQFLNIIPTERPIDKKFSGEGKLTELKEGVIKGKDTKFKKQLHVGCTLKILSSGNELMVKEIIDDNTAKIGKGTFEFSNKEESFFIFPKLNQEQVFKNVYKGLSNGKCIGIFPEGGSHDQTELLELKAGACVFAWGSYKLHKKKVKMIEVGINYFGAHKFRSKVVISIGKPREYEFKEELMEDRNYKREKIGNMLEDLKENLETVKLTAPSYNELVNLYCSKDIYIPDDVELKKDTEFSLLMKFSKAYSKIKDQKDVSELLKEVDLFRRDVKKYGLHVNEIKDLRVVFGPYTLIYVKKLIFFIIVVG